MAVTSERPHATTSSDGTQKQVRYGDLTLYSAFQPIFSLSHMRAAGYEALLRAHNSLDASVSPLDVFGRAARLGDLLELDRLAQSLHLDNFRNLHCDREWLFVHIHPAALADQWQCAALLSELRRLGLKPQRIVLEVSDRQAADLRKLAEGVRIFRQYGFLIALDDFGAGHSNLDRIWQLDPDIVKLDRNIVFHASQRAQVARVLPGLISLLHEAGKLVLIEGIETEREALLAMEGDADFVQGSYFSRPAAAPVDTQSSSTVSRRCSRPIARRRNAANASAICGSRRTCARSRARRPSLPRARRSTRSAGISSRSKMRSAATCSTRTAGRSAAT